MRKIHPEPITEPDSIPLDRHLVIEASAGTGKTYTIERLVARILAEKRVDALEQILVVTFTEKATGELKQRIRALIQERIDTYKQNSGSGDDLTTLTDALNNFDTASIHTINGFCNKILREYAYESGEQFHYELIDDRLIYEKMLLKQMKEDWPRLYGNFLTEILLLSKFPDTTAAGKSQWKEHVVSIAKKYRPAGGDLLHPPLEKNFVDTLSQYEARIGAIFKQLRGMVGEINAENLQESDLYRKYSELNIHAKTKTKNLEKIIKILSILEKHHIQGRIRISDYVEFYHSLPLIDDNFSILNSHWKKPGPDYEEKLPALPAIINLLNTLPLAEISSLQHQLEVTAIQKLKKDVALYKKEHGLISYDDMISLVYRALTNDRGILLDSLRRRYRYALVDEFQDTDSLQWQIFRMIFLEGDSTRLFIIGDPKQAIYGFRGAELSAYTRAREEMLDRYKARFYSLNKNWRSEPGLIAFFNAFFRDDWFSEREIRYEDNFYPDKKKKDDKKTDNRALLEGKNVYTVNLGTRTGKNAAYAMADFISTEIEKLLSTENKGRIKPAEIAVLVKKWSEADIIDRALSDKKIHFSYYKKQGLYQSRESDELQYMIAATARPDDAASVKRALLTRFFSFTPEELLQYEKLPSNHEIFHSFDRWHALAVDRKWSTLFTAFFTETNIIEQIKDDQRYDTILTSFRSIIEDLMLYGFSKATDVSELHEYLLTLKKGNDPSDETRNIHRSADENPGIQIMTVHAAKGLEFRVVFIAGGFTEKNVSPYYEYHTDTGRVFNLVKDDTAKERNTIERRDEEERLYYVAVTRAMERVYLPFFEPTSRAKSSAGILGKKIRDILIKKSFNENVTTITINEDSYSSPSDRPAPHDIPPSREKPAPILEDDGPHLYIGQVSFPDRGIVTRSFSGIKARVFDNNTQNISVPESGGDNSSAVEDEKNEVLYSIPDTTALEKGFILPPGKESGLLLHQVLETADFDSIFKADGPGACLKDKKMTLSISAAIDEYFPTISSDDKILYRDETARIVWNTLHTPLSPHGCMLGTIPRKNRVAEMEFYLHVSPDDRIILPEELTLSADFIHGFIDLLFLYEGRYYILDWKSNYIEGGYTSDLIEKSMTDSHYHLQYTLYAAALIEWLKQRHPDYSYKKYFGGVYYLYLRGIDPRNPDAGIFFTRPPDEDALIVHKHVE